MHPALRFTTSDVEALPDRLDDTRYELIEGELSVAKQPHWDHQLIGVMLSGALLDWSLRTGLGVPNAASGLIFSPEDDVPPDAAPELVIEVLSPGPTNERRDRGAKRKLYALEGVAEYWIIDWRARTVEVYRRIEDALELAATLTDGDTLTSPLLPGFAYPVADLWRLMRG